MISIKNVSFSYSKNDHALKNISLDIPKGKWISIIGHNGSGKSTLSKLLIGLIEAQSGTIVVDDLELNEHNINAIRSKIGIVFQNPDNQFVGVTVKHDIAFGLENRCYTKEQMDEAILRCAKEVYMEEFLEREPHNLSGGQKQRVAIAGVLAIDAEYIIFDEATSMLDPKGVSDIAKLINDIKKNTNKTIITITHDLNLAKNSDEVVVLKDGAVIACDIPSVIFAQEEILNSSNLDMPYSLKLYKRILEDKELSQRKDLVDLLWTSSLKK